MTVHKFLTSAVFSDLPQLVHGFTTRVLAADYDRVAVATQSLVSQFYYLDQAHSADVVIVGEDAELARLPRGDALVTNRRDIILGVRTADCLPILVCEPHQHVVTAIHAGFRGMLAGVIQNALDVMRRAFDAQPEAMLAALGPCIRAENYEVGPEVIADFRKAYGEKGFAYRDDLAPRPHLDLPGTAQIILAQAGLLPEHVSDIGLCTFSRGDLFHSYRRDHGDGRQFNFIGILS
jgi:YfiH family protein